jgi:RNA recognition motif-containing protein
MTTYKEVELRNILDECGSVTVTVVPFDDMNGAHDVTFTNFDEAKNEIAILENSNTVYF